MQQQRSKVPSATTKTGHSPINRVFFFFLNWLYHLSPKANLLLFLSIFSGSMNSVTIHPVAPARNQRVLLNISPSPPLHLPYPVNHQILLGFSHNILFNSSLNLHLSFHLFLPKPLYHPIIGSPAFPLAILPIPHQFLWHTARVISLFHFPS